LGIVGPPRLREIIYERASYGLANSAANPIHFQRAVLIPCLAAYVGFSYLLLGKRPASPGGPFVYKLFHTRFTTLSLQRVPSAVKRPNFRVSIRSPRETGRPKRKGNFFPSGGFIALSQNPFSRLRNLSPPMKMAPCSHTCGNHY